MMKKHFQLLALVALVISAIGFNSCRKDKDDATPTSYTVTFDANGGDKAPKAETVDLGKSITLPAQGDMTAPADKPYFLGWDISKDATTATIPAGVEFTPEADITLYAIWTATKPIYTITFDANGATGTAPKAQTAEDGTSIKLPSNDGMTAPVENYYLLGWSTDKAATEAEFKAGADYLPTENITLYAIWKLSFVKTIEAYMNLTKTQLTEKLEKEGFTYKPHETTNN
ncbi:MAG: InlB B-repeat-containing protein, partial [Phocaeicola sp.]